MDIEQIKQEAESVVSDKSIVPYNIFAEYCLDLIELIEDLQMKGHAAGKIINELRQQIKAAETEVRKWGSR